MEEKNKLREIVIGVLFAHLKAVKRNLLISSIQCDDELQVSVFLMLSPNLDEYFPWTRHFTVPGSSSQQY